MTTVNEERYNGMENVLKAINSKYISLPEAEVARNNEILKLIVDAFVERMKENPLFNILYRDIYYGGSYYVGLKVGKPDEYDLDLWLILPECAKATVTNSNIPGFVQVRVVEDLNISRTNPSEAANFRLVAQELLDNNFLSTTKVAAWMDNVIQNVRLPNIVSSDAITVLREKSGPAHTLKLGGTRNRIPVKMDIDLVPCFVLTQTNWPARPFRQNPIKKEDEFFIVPKRPHGASDTKKHWKLSFQQQENVLINDQEQLKPALRLLKKLRDTENHQISSYYIKTLFLWELENDKPLWKKSLSYVFMTMLKKYKQCIESGTISYYWNANNNLIDDVKLDTRRNIVNRLTIIIRDIENNPANNTVAKYLQKPDELLQLQLNI